MRPKNVPLPDGKVNEDRFFALVSRQEPLKYPWIISIEKADPELDAHGVDALATVLPKPGKRGLATSCQTLPIQIKSSCIRKCLFYRYYGSNYRLFVAVIVVNHERSDENIQEQLATELGRRRSLVPAAIKHFLATVSQTTDRRSKSLGPKLSNQE